MTFIVGITISFVSLIVTSLKAISLFSLAAFKISIMLCVDMHILKLSACEWLGFLNLWITTAF